MESPDGDRRKFAVAILNEFSLPIISDLMKSASCRDRMLGLNVLADMSARSRKQSPRRAVRDSGVFGRRDKRLLLKETSIAGFGLDLLFLEASDKNQSIVCAARMLREEILSDNQGRLSKQVQLPLETCPGFQAVREHDKNRPRRSHRFFDSKSSRAQFAVSDNERRWRKEVSIPKVVEMNADISCRQTLKYSGLGSESNDSQYAAAHSLHFLVHGIDDLSQAEIACSSR